MREYIESILADAKEQEIWRGAGLGNTNEDVWKFYELIGRIRENKGIVNKALVPTAYKKAFEAKLADSFQKIRTEHLDIQGKKKKRFEKKDMFKYTNILVPGDFALFRDILILFDFSEEPSMLVITKKNRVEEYRQFFESLWKLAK
jgi:hypothetical protein